MIFEEPHYIHAVINTKLEAGRAKQQLSSKRSKKKLNHF